MKDSKQYWLLKTEGDSYPIDQLRKDKKTPWSGVRNYQARNFMRDKMQVGDLCLFYHTGEEKGVYGIAKVVSRPYADPTQFDKKSHWFEPKASKENPIWMLVDIAFVKKFKEPVSIREMKSDPTLSGMILFRAPRLSIQPLSPAHFEYITEELRR